MAQISAKNIQGLEKRFVSAWTGAGSTPFIVDVVLSDVDLELATKVVQSFPISRIFELCPTVACWGTLKGLSDSYDGGNRHVYEPISAVDSADVSSPVLVTIHESQFKYDAGAMGGDE